MPPPPSQPLAPAMPTWVWMPWAGALPPARFSDLHSCPLRFLGIVAMASPVIFRDAASMRAFSREQRRQGKSIGFVPTMVRCCVDLAGRSAAKC